MKNQTIESVLKEKKAEIALMEKMVKQAGKLGLRLTLTKGQSVAIPATKRTYNKTRKHVYSNAEFKQIRSLILGFTKDFSPKDAVRDLKKAGFKKLKAHTIYSLLWTMKNEGKLTSPRQAVYKVK